MARCKCRLCGKQLTTDEAYLVKHITKTGKTQNWYYCSQEEIEEHNRNTELWRASQREIDEILGYVCVNKKKIQMLQELRDIGYTNEQIFRCIKHHKDEIRDYMNLKNIDNEYQKLCYIFTVIKNVIKDFTEEDKINNDWEQYATKEENVEIEIEEPSFSADFKVNKRKKLF